MAVNLSPIGNGFQFFNNDGLPLNAGKIYTYQAGSSTPLATYTSSSGLTANANPIILGTSGRPPNDIWLTEGYFYKFILKDSADVTIQTYDNLYGIIGATPPAATPIPAGGIFLWSGSIGSIPAGYVLCNGSNGTPDLRDRFVVGAGSTYSVDGTGGSANAIVVSHTHTFSETTASNGIHNHDVIGTKSDGYTIYGADKFYTVSSSPPSQYVDALKSTGILNAGSHTHTVSGTTASAGNSGTNANLPPYYALCYIMKT
jgi:microcystin-dependent protein